MLWPFGFLYGGAVAARNFAYQKGWKSSHAAGVPVVSVGNISTGGTGKTPMAEYLIRWCLEKGKRPAYLSRGYGRSTKGFLWVDPKSGQAERFGDEAYQVALKFPEVAVAVCEDRVAGAARMRETREFELLILDDAFQHLRIRRDLNLVLVDAARLPWEDLMLPAGNLREFRSGLERADLIVGTKFAGEGRALRDVLERKVGPDRHAGFRMLQEAPLPFQGNRIFPETPKPLVLFSGLGNNPHFIQQVESGYGKAAATFTFPDHHRYHPEDLRKILSAVPVDTENKSNLAGAVVLTSEKDFARLREEAWMAEFKDAPLYYVPARLEPVWGGDLLDAHLSRIMNL